MILFLRTQKNLLYDASVSRDLKLISFTKQMYIELTEKESGYIFASYYEEKLTLENQYD